MEEALPGHKQATRVLHSCGYCAYDNNADKASLASTRPEKTRLKTLTAVMRGITQNTSTKSGHGGSLEKKTANRHDLNKR